MKKITTDPVKMELVSRLVKEGAIDFSEAIKLLEVEVEYVGYPDINAPATAPPYGWPIVTYQYDLMGNCETATSN